MTPNAAQPTPVTASGPTPAAEPQPFPRSARVLDGASFRRVFATGRRLSGRAFQLHVLEAAQVPETPEHEAAQLQAAQCETAQLEATPVPRLGLAVSRRVDRRAVQRNRIKRAAREAFRSMRARLPAADYVLSARREAVALSNAALREELVTLFGRAASLKPRVAGGTMPALAPDRARRAP